VLDVVANEKLVEGCIWLGAATGAVDGRRASEPMVRVGAGPRRVVYVSTPPEVAAQAEAHGVIQPTTVYVEA